MAANTGQTDGSDERIGLLARLLSLIGSLIRLVTGGQRDPAQLCQLLQIVKNEANWYDQLIGAIVNLDADPFVPRGLRVGTHKKGGPFVLRPNNIQLFYSKDLNRKTIKGEELIKELELRSRPILNANILDYLLAHPEFIPENWKSEKVFFLGTIYLDSHNERYVRGLEWCDGRWGCCARWLSSDWGHFDSVALLVPRVAA